MMRIEGFIVVFCISLIFRYAGVQVYFINRILAIWTDQTKWQASEAHGTDRQANGNPHLLRCKCCYSGTGFHLEYKTHL